MQVVDTGIGIKPEDLKKLYSPFERIEEKRNRAIEGTGLGMSIVKNLLAAMGSSLVVKSEYGKGSDFSFTVEQEVCDWEEIGDWKTAHEKASAESTRYTEPFQAPEAKILVVDDTPMNLTVIKGLLKPTRVQIDTAEDGFAGIEKTKSQKYDIIFIDHLMPKMDGLEMLAALKKEPGENQNTPCIVLTANAVGNAREMYINSGFSAYLSKPIDSKLLESQMQEFLPKEKIQKISREQKTVSSEQDNHSDPLFKEFFGLDSASALKNCGSAEIFSEAVKTFWEAIQEKVNIIEEYEKKADWQNYTIQVHALKSSARLIGANELSEIAKQLEASGDEAKKSKENAIAEIHEKTPALLQKYREYLKKLAPLCEEVFSANSIAIENTKHIITQKEFNDALSALHEVISVFDFDTADEIIKQLDGYEMPKNFAEKYKKIRKAVRDVDANAVQELLKSS